MATGLLSTVVAAMCLAVVGAALSGFYYDNGLDQTVASKRLSKREKKEMQSEILHLLGLEHRPHPSVRPSQREKEQDDMLSSAPRFLIDVYQSLTEEDTGDLKLQPDLMEREFNVSRSDVNSMEQADIIVSFVNRGQHLHSIRHHHSDGRFWFDLSEVASPTSVIAAELRLYLNQSLDFDEETQARHKREQADVEDEEDENDNVETVDDSNSEREQFFVVLYEITEGDGLAYVDQMEIDHEQEGWIGFNVTIVLKHWMHNPRHNFGLQLVCKDASTGRRISTRQVGLVGSHGDEKLQPFMVAFLRSAGQAPSSSGSVSSRTLANNVLALANDSADEDDDVDDGARRRSRRQANKSNRKRSKDPEDVATWNPYADIDPRYARRSCQKKNLYVSFRDLGWQDWIIAPDGYAAFYCNGECSFPLNAHMNASNHAIVQTLVHLMNPYQVPKPCCAPIKLSSISVLYFDDNSNVILKKYRNMVVKSCGCH